jgi:hypothetical protein
MRVILEDDLALNLVRLKSAILILDFELLHTAWKASKWHLE